jgi:hypothetical protein
MELQQKRHRHSLSQFKLAITALVAFAVKVLWSSFVLERLLTFVQESKFNQ